MTWIAPRALAAETAMLRITVHKDDRLCRLELAGRLWGPWVEETENVWRSLACAGKQVEVDMRQVRCVDDAGRELLSVMYQAGARLVAEGLAMTALVEEIAGNQPAAVPRAAQRKNLPADQRSRIRRNRK